MNTLENVVLAAARHKAAELGVDHHHAESITEVLTSPINRPELRLDVAQTMFTAKLCDDIPLRIPPRFVQAIVQSYWTDLERTFQNRTLS